MPEVEFWGNTVHEAIISTSINMYTVIHKTLMALLHVIDQVALLDADGQISPYFHANVLFRHDFQGATSTDRQGNS